MPGPTTTDPSAARDGHDASASIPVRIRVNGDGHTLALDPRTTLLDLLRERLGLFGAKKGCDHGQCGACPSRTQATADMICPGVQ